MTARFPLSHVRLLVADYPASFRFWRDVVGLTPTFGDEQGGYADFDMEPAALAIFDSHDPGGNLIELYHQLEQSS